MTNPIYMIEHVGSGFAVVVDMNATQPGNMPVTEVVPITTYIDRRGEVLFCTDEPERQDRPFSLSEVAGVVCGPTKAGKWLNIHPMEREFES